MESYAEVIALQKRLNEIGEETLELVRRALRPPNPSEPNPETEQWLEKFFPDLPKKTKPLGG